MAYLENLRMPEFQELREKCRTIIIPCGSVEEHGAHLPLGTDTFHALEVAQRVAQARPVLVAPPLFYGLCRSTRDHPGTISLSGDTLRAVILDLGREFYRQGLRNLVYLSGHAGGAHMVAILEAGEILLTEFPEINVAVVNILELLREVLTAQPDLIHTRGDSHAGEVETSIMLAARPHLVSGAAPEEWPEFPKYLLVRDKTRYWPGGVWGNPGKGSPEQGEKILQAETQRLCEVIDLMEKPPHSFS
jgi:creatinine amidohydrolase